MSECVFCEILAGNLPSSTVYQDQHCTVFMDINPINPGHMLVVPNYHAPNLAALDEKTAGYLFKIAQRMAAALRKSGLQTEGVNIFLADGEAAGQEVFHLHLHVAPRFKGDGFKFQRGPDNLLKPDRTGLNLNAEAIRRQIKTQLGTALADKEEGLAATILQQLRRHISTKQYTKIRRLWKAHSTAEDQRDIPGLLATLTEDCVYTLANNGATWKGHAGATRFYTELLTAFPDIHFDLQNIVIGPQGVFEEAHVHATHKNNWQNFPATGERVEFDVLIFFPYDVDQELFAGERVYMFLPD